MMQINIFHVQDKPKDSQPSDRPNERGGIDRDDPRGDQGGGKDRVDENHH